MRDKMPLNRDLLSKMKMPGSATVLDLKSTDAGKDLAEGTAGLPDDELIQEVLKRGLTNDIVLANAEAESSEVSDEEGLAEGDDNGESTLEEAGQEEELMASSPVDELKLKMRRLPKPA